MLIFLFRKDPLRRNRLRAFYKRKLIKTLLILHNLNLKGIYIAFGNILISTIMDLNVYNNIK